MENKPQLFDAELEIGLIGAILANPELYERISDAVAADDFGDPVLGAVFTRLGEMRAQNMAINPATAYSACRDIAGLNDLGGARFFANAAASGVTMQFAADTSAQMVADLARRRRAVEIAKSVIERAERHDLRTALEVETELEKALTALSPREAVSLSGTISDVIGEIVVEALEVQQGGDGEGIQLKDLPEWDEIVGSMLPTDVTVLAGRPGMGKTSVAVKVATSAARQGFGVVYFSQEMTKQQLVRRALCDLMYKGRADDIPLDTFRRHAFTEAEFRRVMAAQEAVSDWPLIIHDQGGMKLSEMMRHCRRYARQFERQGRRLDLVIIDHLQLVKGENPRAPAYEKMTEISRDTKILAKTQRCHVLALSQLNRKVEDRDDKRPQMADLRESGAIEEDASNIIMLYRHEYYLKKERKPDDPDPALEFELEKCRNRLELLARKVRDGAPEDKVVKFIAPFQAIRSARD